MESRNGQLGDRSRNVALALDFPLSEQCSHGFLASGISTLTVRLLDLCTLAGSEAGSFSCHDVRHVVVTTRRPWADAVLGQANLHEFVRHFSPSLESVTLVGTRLQDVEPAVQKRGLRIVSRAWVPDAHDLAEFLETAAWA